MNAFLKRDGFWEREIARRVDRYGNVAHVFSTYESRVNSPDTAPFSRGIKRIQLVTNGERWWVVTIVWDFERQGIRYRGSTSRRPEMRNEERGYSPRSSFCIANLGIAQRRPRRRFVFTPRA